MEEMERDPAVVILGEDVGREGGVFRVTDGLQARFGADRVIDTPLAESGIVGTAFGMAVKGLRPVAEIQFEGFLAPAMDQIMSHIARIRTRSRGRFTAPLVIRSPFGGGIHAPEHHSDSPEAIFIHTPGIKVVIPASPYDAKGLIKAAIRDADPVLFFEPKRIYRAIKEEVPDEDYTVPIGKAKVVREGNDVTLISWGAMVRETLRAAEMVEKEGVKAEVIDLRTLSPMDEETFLISVRKTGRAVIVQEAPRTCGLGAEISARIQETALLSLQAPVERITGFDTIVPLLKLENHYLPNPERIIRGIRKVMAF
jgi:pyruvate dehydrogenase E1 component beta subunit